MRARTKHRASYLRVDLINEFLKGFQGRKRIKNSRSKGINESEFITRRSNAKM